MPLHYSAKLLSNTNAELVMVIQTKFRKAQQEAFIYDVLLGKEIIALQKWYKKKYKPWEQLVISMLEFAFDLLLSFPKSWLKQHTPFIEEVYKKHKTKNPSKKDEQVITKINSIVSVTKTGLSTEFIMDIMKKTVDKSEITTLHLLNIKILEEEAEFCTDTYLSKIKLEKNQYLIPVGVYLFMNKEPRKAISSLFSIEFNVEESLEKYKPSEEVKKMLDVYVRKAIFNLLNPGKREDFKWFLEYKNKFSEAWIIELIDTCLNHESLKKIKKQFMNTAKFVGSTQARIDAFEENF